MSCVDSVDGKFQQEVRLINTLLGKIDFLGAKPKEKDLCENAKSRLIPQLPNTKSLPLSNYEPAFTDCSFVDSVQN